jgi:hypothetical protein
MCAPDDQRLVDVEMQQKCRLRGGGVTFRARLEVSRDFDVYSEEIE